MRKPWTKSFHAESWVEAALFHLFSLFAFSPYLTQVRQSSLMSPLRR